MHIVEIVIDGFKSYAQRVCVSGFDPQFNAITGLNGSGKSNVLDAICFVLGISQLSQVRASSLNELIYKGGQAGVTKASVTLVFDNQDRSQSPHGYEHYSQITVTRQVALGGRNKYLINGHTAQLQRVQNLFHSVQLNVNNPHFLIMQGRITKVLNMKPPEILGMIEEAAGTRMFELKKQQAVKTIEKKEVKLDEIKRVINEDILPRFEKLGSERSQYLEFTKLSSNVESLARFCQAWQLHDTQQALAKFVASAEKNRARCEELQQDVEAASTQQAELAEERKQTEAKLAQERGEHMAELEHAEQEAGKELVLLSSQHAQDAQALQADDEAKVAIEKSIRDAAAQHKKVAAELAKAADKAAKAKAAHEEQTATLHQRQAQYEADIGMGNGGSGAKNLQGQLSDAAAALRERETEKKAAEHKAKHIAKELAAVEKKLTAARKSGAAQERAISSLRAELSRLDASLLPLASDEAAEAQAAQAHQRAAQALAEKKAQEERMAQALSGVDFRYTDPERNFDRRRVKGTVAANLTLKDTQHATALEAFAGARLRQVVVDTMETGSLLLQRGKLQRRVTLIPLDKIRASTLPADKISAARKLVGDRATPAIELINFEPTLAPAMAHVFGNGMVCTDKASARAVCEQLRIKTVTLEGDLYDPQGTLTGGSRPTGSGSLLCKLAQLSELRVELTALEASHSELSAQLEAARAKAERLEQLRGEQELKRHQLQLQEEAMRASELYKLSTEAESLQKQLADTEAAASAAASAVAAAAEAREALASALAEYEGNKEQRLAQSKAALTAAEKEVKATAKALQSAQQAEQTHSLRLEDIQKSKEAEEAQLVGMSSRRVELEKKSAASAAKELACKERYDAAEGALKRAKAQLDGYHAELTRIKEEAEAADKKKAEAQLELKQAEHTLARHNKEKAAAESAEADLLKKHAWLTAERHLIGQAGGPYDFKKRKPAAAQQELAKQTSQLENLGKRINKKVLAMFEKAEAEYADLMAKKDTVEKDKAKIEAVIEELAQKKIESLQKTWEKVNGDFGSIFSTLLPGTNAKLEPQEGCSVEDGLVVKVAFGNMWKQSLIDLSGGQRSLVALSLVLSLLRFKPAPVYILDEIDAALDLSHTQNIGMMIKSHFSQSQFIVVSLKEGMFNNANVLFRTKFVDGVSTITRTVPPGAAARDKEKAATAAGKTANASRKALVPVN